MSAWKTRKIILPGLNVSLLERKPQRHGNGQETKEKAMKLTLELTDREVELMRNCLSDLGINDGDCVSLQLKVANAILDAKLGETHET